MEEVGRGLQGVTGWRGDLPSRSLASQISSQFTHLSNWPCVRHHHRAGHPWAPLGACDSLGNARWTRLGLCPQSSSLPLPPSFSSDFLFTGFQNRTESNLSVPQSRVGGAFICTLLGTEDGSPHCETGIRKRADSRLSSDIK